MPLVVDLDLAWLRVAIRDMRCCSDPIALLVQMATPAGEYNWRASLIAVVRVLPDKIVERRMAVFDQSLPKSGLSSIWLLYPTAVGILLHQC
jgi:hypothetical protein